MKKYLIVVISLLLLSSCSKTNTGAADKAMKIVEERFSNCLLKDSLRESSMAYLWAEYDSKYNSILSFQYGGIAIEYFYHSNEYGELKDTFMRRGEKPYIDELRNSYYKINGGYKSSGLNISQDKFMNGFSDYFKRQYPKEEEWIEDMIKQIACN